MKNDKGKTPHNNGQMFFQSIQILIHSGEQSEPTSIYGRVKFKVKMKSTLLFFVFVVVGTTFVATECPLPDLPKFYSTTLQVNIAKSERANPLPKNVGHTVSMVEVVDETMARAVLEIKYGRFNYKHYNLSFYNIMCYFVF